MHHWNLSNIFCTKQNDQFITIIVADNCSNDFVNIQKIRPYIFIKCKIVIFKIKDERDCLSVLVVYYDLYQNLQNELINRG